MFSIVGISPLTGVACYSQFYLPSASDQIILFSAQHIYNTRRWFSDVKYHSLYHQSCHNNMIQTMNSEFMMYSCIWIGSLIYATVELYKTGFKLHEDPSPLDHVTGGWYRDTTDLEWKSWKYFTRQSMIHQELWFYDQIYFQRCSFFRYIYSYQDLEIYLPNMSNVTLLCKAINNIPL